MKAVIDISDMPCSVVAVRKRSVCKKAWQGYGVPL